MTTPWDAVAITIRVEVAQELVRRACDVGCRAVVDGNTCLVTYPDRVQMWCDACLMAGAGDMIQRAADYDRTDQ